MQKLTHFKHVKWTLKFGFYMIDFIKSNNLFKDHCGFVVMLYALLKNLNETILR